MQRSPSPYRVVSPNRSTSPYYQPPANQHRDYPLHSTGQAPADGSLTYTTSIGKEGQPLYHVFKAVPASYTISNNVVNGMQWVPVEVTETLPAGVPAAAASMDYAAFNRKTGDDRRRLSEAEAKRMQDLEKDLLSARELDAQNRERRKSNASVLGSSFSTSGSVGSGTQYHRNPYNAYSPSTSSAYSDLDRQMGNLDLRDRGKDYSAEKEVKTPRPQKYTASEVGDRPRSPHPGVRPVSRSEGPYGAATAFGAYSNTGRPYSTAGYQPSTSPNSRPAEVPFIPPGNVAYRTTDPLPRSTTPSAGAPRAVYPPGHILEGQPILPQDRARMTPIPRGPSPVPPGPYNAGAVGLSQSRSAPNMSAGAPPTVGRGAPPQQLAAPEGFARSVNMSHPFTPFDIMKIQDMEKFWFEVPRMPAVLVTHDVLEEDWCRLMRDMALAWGGKLFIPEPEQGGPMPRRSTIVVDLVNLWNESFFLLRGVELILFRGKERCTGRHVGLIERTLPYLDEPDDYISSEEEGFDDDPDSDPEYGAGRYQRSGYLDPQQQLAEIFEEGRRRKEAKIAHEAERRRRRQERHRKRREKIRERGYGGSGGYSSGGHYAGHY